MKKLVLVAGVLIAATTAASAQGYVYYGNPYGYGIGTALLAIGCTTGAAARGEAITRNRHDERNKNHNRIGSSGQRCGDSEPDANAKLRAEPA